LNEISITFRYSLHASSGITSSSAPESKMFVIYGASRLLFVLGFLTAVMSL